MYNQPYPERHMPQLPIDPGEITSRLRELVSADLCGHCGPAVTNAIPDIARLATEVHVLYAALAAERLRSANLEAAIRAALGARADGEPDPFAYLRDELPDNAGGDAYGA